MMLRWLPLLLIFTLLNGCQSAGPHARGPDACRMFAPLNMRIHPIFTRVRDWSGDGRPDGIEALLEFQDQFNDPTKAMGAVVFELYSYRPYASDVRGERLTNPWIGHLTTLAQQREHWNRTSRTYSFQLAYPGIQTHRTYVLTAIFQRSGGGRFFDQMLIEPTPTENAHAATRPIQPPAAP